jgi:hypothetical protein
MLHVTLDAGALSSDPDRDKSSFRALMKLVHANKAKLYLSGIVKEGFVSNRVREYEEAFCAADSSIKSLACKKLSKFILRDLENIRKKLDELKEEIVFEPKREFQLWENKAKIEVRKIGDQDAEKVFQSYFEGDIPFTDIMERRDIPGAFVFECIKRLADNHGTMLAIIDDSVLRDACGQFSNIITYPTLEDFIQSDEAREMFDMMGKLERALPRIVELLEGKKANVFEGVLGSQLDEKLQGERFKYEGIPGDKGEATIRGDCTLYSMGFKYSDAYVVGDEMILVPFRAEVEAKVHYSKFNDGSYSICGRVPEKKRAAGHGGHFSDGEETLGLIVHGKLRIHVNTEMIYDEIEDVYGIIDSYKSGIDEITGVSLLGDTDSP